MYVDGYLAGKYGESHKVSALETLQFSAISVIDDVSRCVSMDSKMPGDLIYVLGTTANELGGSEYYAHLGYVGLSVPRVLPEVSLKLYRALQNAITKGLVASVHGIYQGGLGVHLAMVAMGGNLGMDISLNPVPVNNIERDDTILFSESAGRFIVTVDPAGRKAFEKNFSGLACSCIGQVTTEPDIVIKGLKGTALISVAVQDLKAAWKEPFGDLI
jgi:phosphoribosylformylglycinamidine synthase